MSDKDNETDASTLSTATPDESPYDNDDEEIQPDKPEKNNEATVIEQISDFGKDGYNYS